MSNFKCQISNKEQSEYFCDWKFGAGFTLIELLVVIAIIGVLTALTTVNYISIKARARDAQRKSDLRQIQLALEGYRSDQGNYPTVNLVTCGQGLTSGTTTYIQKIPCDPTNVGQLSYRYLLNGNGYSLI